MNFICILILLHKQSWRHILPRNETSRMDILVLTE